MEECFQMLMNSVFRTGASRNNMEGFVEPRGRNRKIPVKFSIRGAKVECVGSWDSRGTFRRMEREGEEEGKKISAWKSSIEDVVARIFLVSRVDEN